MFKRILNLMRQDWTNALRDNILIYMMVAPILLAVGARLFVPSIGEAQYTFAVQDGVDSALIQRLDSIGTVELLPSAEAVRARVLRSDDVPGLVLVDGQQTLLMEGNEGGEAEILQRVFQQVLSGEPVSVFTRAAESAARSLITEYTAIIFIMIGALLGALVMAFNIIEDKESRAIRALGVSPLSMLELTLARGFFALLLSLVLVFASTAILVGGQVNYGLLLVAFLFSVGLPILTGYIIGGLADSQLKAIAILKFYMLVYLTLPIVSIVIPREWHFFFYILPNYWMWQTFERVFIGEQGGPNLWISGLATLVSSLALVVIFLPVLRRQLKLR
jgi:ABC-2 type transport system permease protein